MKSKILDAIGRHRPILLKSNFVESHKEFADKTALVIGGGSGIGKEIAASLLEAGAKVIVAGRKKYEIEGMASDVWDVKNVSEIPAHIENLVAEYGRIDIVVNSQGVCPDDDFFKRFYNIDSNDFEFVMKTNLESVFFLCQNFCQYFEENQIHGHILNICSTEGVRPAIVPYGISKTGVIAFTRGLGKFMAPKGIIVNGIAPGATATNMMRVGFDDNLRMNYIPSKRLTTPKEIAMTAMFLLSDTGNQMCGQVVIVDGGESL